MSKKEKADKPKKLSEGDAAKAVLEFMRRGNRPYNTQMIIDQLKGAISKSVAEKVLTTLSESGSITVKMFGKASVYWVKQEDLGETDKEGFTKLEEQVNEKKEVQKVLMEECKDLRAQISRLLTQPTNDKADEAIEALKKENVALEKKLDILKGGQKLVTPEQRMMAKKRYDATNKEWRSRKRIFKEMFNAVLDGYGDRKPEEVMEELGIETDEAAGVSQENDQTSKRLKGK